MKYGILKIDPPWEKKKGGLRKVRPKQTRELEDFSTRKGKSLCLNQFASAWFTWGLNLPKDFMFVKLSAAQNFTQNLSDFGSATQNSDNMRLNEISVSARSEVYNDK